MLIYNTTYTVPNDDARNFVIWVHQVMLPRVAEEGTLRKPRMLRILSHKDPDTECFGLQFEVESTALLHRWFVKLGKPLSEEMLELFAQRVVGFMTIMEEIGGE